MNVRFNLTVTGKNIKRKRREHLEPRDLMKIMVEEGGFLDRDVFDIIGRMMVDERGWGTTNFDGSEFWAISFDL